jgi:hypothetical protein
VATKLLPILPPFCLSQLVSKLSFCFCHTFVRLLPIIFHQYPVALGFELRVSHVLGRCS